MFLTISFSAVANDDHQRIIAIERSAHHFSRSFFDDQNHASAVAPIRDCEDHLYYQSPNAMQREQGQEIESVG